MTVNSTAARNEDKLQAVVDELEEFDDEMEHTALTNVVAPFTNDCSGELNTSVVGAAVVGASVVEFIAGGAFDGVTITTVEEGNEEKATASTCNSRKNPQR